MKLGIDASSLLTSHTGVHVYIREIIRALQAEDDGRGLCVFQPGAYPWQARHAGAKIYNNLRLGWWIQVQVRRRLRKNACQALISPDFLSPLALGLPKIVVVYDAGFVKRPGDFNLLWRLLWQWLYFPALKQARAVVTITETARREICDAFGLDSGRVTVIPPACDTRRFKPGPMEACREALQKYGLQPGRYFLHVGVKEKRKNLPRLIRAFARIASNHPALKLVLAGPAGPKLDLDDSREIAEEIRRQGLDKCVILPGYVPQADLPLLYQGASALVFPSLHEGFGIPILEAFACRTAVLCSESPVLREVAQSGAGYFDPASEDDMAKAMSALLDQPGLREELIGRGQEQGRNYSWQKSGRAFLELAERFVA